MPLHPHLHWIHRASRMTLFALLLGLSWAGSAQVIRCTDPATGRVTYTDGECMQGQSRKEVAPRQTPEDLQRQYEQAQQALELRRERQQLQAAQTPAPAPVPSAPQVMEPAQSAECQQARTALRDAMARDATLYDTNARIDSAQQNVDLACLTSAEYARLRQRLNDRPPLYVAPPVFVIPPRTHPHRPPRKVEPKPKPGLSECDVFWCYGRQGKSPAR